VVVDATDNFPAHYLINDAALIAGKPFVFGQVIKNTCTVSVFNHTGGPSLRCLYPSVPRNGEKFMDKELSAINILYQITGTLMAHEAIKIILAMDSDLNGKLLHFRPFDYNIAFKSIQKNPENFVNPKFR
jgi:adenylyltransferase/sulfurtransferase